MIDLTKISTEQRNPESMHIDTLSTLDMLTVINQNDQTVPLAVAKVLPTIAAAVDLITGRLQSGGRLFYLGAGTSGRLGILDAVECPPTYSTEPELVQGLIAGGSPAVFRAQEGAEDKLELAATDLQQALDELADPGVQVADLQLGECLATAECAQVLLNVSG